MEEIEERNYGEEEEEEEEKGKEVYICIINYRTVFILGLKKRTW